MDIRTLRYFLAVAREESITGAAAVLHLTQPTLSRQLMELESELGKQLFIRGKRRVTLTEDGILLRKRALEIVELMDKTEAEFREPGESVAGKVYIGAGETQAMRLIARVAKELGADHPLLHYHLFSGNADDVTERLDKGLLDFGVLIEPFDMKKYDCFKLPVTDTWGVLMRRDHPLAQRESIRPQDLKGIPLFSSRRSMIKNEFSRWFGQEFDGLNIVGTFNLIFNAALMVEEGLGCALCLDKLVGTSGNASLCFRPLEPRLEVGLDIVWKKYQIFSKPAELFLERLKKASANLAADQRRP
ncbi:LysR family transcriptional regulator [Anaerofilum sp. BX8]|uniref:LysR family transcriptional regulator n=1 Tax=Anaerofilum hominis TaxID=2763016 RepID=A0A923L089_9FIRM|nr:LysR family transcriptional regulator [Anaerofilum hominis]MBC5579952.1 LysR family transcriptional regulator [Anaerofilum hominis]